MNSMRDEEHFSSRPMEQQAITSERVLNQEHDANLGITYNGRVDFGVGAINAEETTQEQFIGQLKYIAGNGLEYVPNYEQLFGNCMDGRGDDKTLGGIDVTPRPKLLGGPSVFGWYVATAGNFSILEGIEDPVEQFTVINKQLHKAGFKLGMHVECGAARGVVRAHSRRHRARPAGRRPDRGRRPAGGRTR